METGMKEINIEAAINGLNLQYRLKVTKEEAIKRIVDSVDYAKKHGLTVDFVLSDGSRTPLEDILTVFEAAAGAGASKLAIADTVGFLRPLAMRYLMSHVRDGFSEKVRKTVPLSVHCHNDFGLATANTLASVEEGATYLHTSLVGYGERAGLAPFEEVVAALELLYNIDTGIDMERIYRFSTVDGEVVCLAHSVPQTYRRRHHLHS